MVPDHRHKALDGGRRLVTDQDQSEAFHGERRADPLPGVEPVSGRGPTRNASRRASNRSTEGDRREALHRGRRAGTRKDQPIPGRRPTRSAPRRASSWSRNGTDAKHCTEGVEPVPGKGPTRSATRGRRAGPWKGTDAMRSTEGAEPVPGSEPTRCPTRRALSRSREGN